MKILPYALCVSLGLAASTMAQTVTWTNYLRQRQMGSGVELQADVGATGSRLALLPLELQGANFQIWTLKSGTGNTPLLLDSKFVNAYQLSSDIQVISADDYHPVGTNLWRVRVDQPFTLRVNVGGLTSDASAEEAARKVSLRHDVQTFPDGVHVPPQGGTSSNFYNGFIQQNGWYTIAFNTSNIVSQNLIAASGEEFFTAASLAGYKAPATTLATARLQVWPVANASLSGITAGTDYKELPEVTLQLNDLYPDSETWIQTYKGPPRLGVSGTVIPPSVITINDVTPQDRTFILRNWFEYVNEESEWTLEVLHTTPFGTERLAYVSFYVNMTISMCGQVFSSE